MALVLPEESGLRFGVWAVPGEPLLPGDPRGGDPWICGPRAGFPSSVVLTSFDGFYPFFS